MKILIFEGIATSGKSTIIAGLHKQLNGLDIKIVSESETHIPIMNETSEAHVVFFEKLLEKLLAEQADVLLIDRLYITQALRSNKRISIYDTIENTLHKYSTTTILLQVSTKDIQHRVQTAAEHRDTEWRDHINTKGNNPAEIANYYEDQQIRLKVLVEESRLNMLTIDTTNNNYNEIIDLIIEKLHLKTKTL